MFSSYMLPKHCYVFDFVIFHCYNQYCLSAHWVDKLDLGSNGRSNTSARRTIMFLLSSGKIISHYVRPLTIQSQELNNHNIMYSNDIVFKGYNTPQWFLSNYGSVEV